jgi:myo-inositol-1-phosphate synthase
MAVKVAIAGVGNCAAVFAQGLKFYSGGKTNGLWHPRVAGLRPQDIEIVAAFDIDPRKVGLDLSSAAFAPPNVARKYLELPKSRVTVSPGISKGDLAPHLKGVKPDAVDSAEVVSRLDQAGADILLDLISSGSDASSEEYAKAALRAGCAFVNCTPTLLLKKNSLVASFRRSRLPLVGDDLMSQFGGTSFHRGLLRFMVGRGVKVSKSYQLDVGGGSETLNTIDEAIKMAKRTVKTTSVTTEVPYKFETIAGTTDYVDYMGNDRTSYFWFEGSGFMDSGISVDIYLRSSDGANAGNILFDVLRATYKSMRSKNLRNVKEICAYGFKSPPQKWALDEAYSKFAKRFLN